MSERTPTPQELTFKEWTFTIYADSAKDLIQELHTVAAFVMSSPPMFNHAPIDTQLDITDNCKASRSA